MWSGEEAIHCTIPFELAQTMKFRSNTCHSRFVFKRVALGLCCTYGSVSVPDGLTIYSATNTNRADKDAGVTASPDM